MTDTTKQMEQERAAFEAWFAANKFGGMKESMWAAWEARATPVSPAQTIDTPEFTHLLEVCVRAGLPFYKHHAEPLIDYIDARLASAKPQSDLHSSIMNLRPNVDDCTLVGSAAEIGYKQGHRDARHAAAELVAAAQNDALSVLRSLMNDTGLVQLMRPDQIRRASDVLTDASVGAQVAGEPVYQMRRIDRTHATDWVTTDADAETCIKRMPHWKDLYEFRTLYTAPVPAPVTVPHEMVPLRMEFEPGYPEDVAFGSQMQMGRLKKWLDKYFAILATQTERQPQPAAQAAVPDHKIYAVIDSMGWSLDDTEKDDMYRLCCAAIAIVAPAAVPQGVEAQKGGADHG